MDDFAEVLSGDEWKGRTGLTMADFSQQSLDLIRRETGLSDERLAELLDKGHIEDIGACVCPQCIIDSEQADER